MDDAFQFADLGQVRPVAVARQQVGGPQTTLFYPATVLVDLDNWGITDRFRFPDGGDVL